MGQIMRLRRIAGNDLEIEDRNNGARHEHAFVENIKRHGILHEADLLPDSYGGKLHPRALPTLMGSLPVVVKALRRGKMTLGKVLLHPHKASKQVKAIFKEVESHEQRYELNLYVSGRDEDDDSAPAAKAGAKGAKA
jgi:succinate dehydrogenase / fumarate reductase iron-sulfur subunit